MDSSKLAERVPGKVLAASRRIRLSQPTLLIVLAVLVGVGAGLLTVVFHWLIGTFQSLLFGLGDHVLAFLGSYYVILIPAIGGLFVGPLIHFLAREAKGCGVPEVMEAVALHEGVIRPRVMVVKTLAAAFYIGSGGSVGSEGPVVQLGSAIGSAVGQVLKTSGDVRKTLVGCGAAAGIAATFGAPMAGVLFALELILGEFSTSTFSPIVISAVLASVTAQAFFGNQPAFPVPDYALVNPSELVLYVLLGVTTALVATFFIRVLYKTGDLWDSIATVPPYLKPAIGGLMVGALGVYFPQILGMGFGHIGAALHSQMMPALLLALVGLKILATSLSIGSGGSGGVFAPSLYVGAMLGGAFGSLIHTLYPATTAASGAYSLVGMGALFAGTTQAPMTAIVMLFELTRDYHIILPLMITCVISSIVAGRLSRETIYTTKLARRGIQLRAGRDANVLRRIPVSAAMVTQLSTVKDTMTLGDVIQCMQESRHSGFPVLSEAGQLVGIITLQDIRDTPLENRLQTPVRERMSTDLIAAYPDETLNDVVERLSYRDVGRVPVVDRGNPQRLLGLITRSDIIGAYKRAAMQREDVLAQQHSHTRKASAAVVS